MKVAIPLCLILVACAHPVSARSGAAATPAKSKTVVFIHGVFMTPRSWEPWAQYLSGRGYKTISPAWPEHEGTPAELRAKLPNAKLAALTLDEVVELYAKIVGALPTVACRSPSVPWPGWWTPRSRRSGSSRCSPRRRSEADLGRPRAAVGRPLSGPWRRHDDTEKADSRVRESQLGQRFSSYKPGAAHAGLRGALNSSSRGGVEMQAFLPRVVCTVVAVFWLAVGVPGTGSTSELELRLSALCTEPGEVTYSLFLEHRGVRSKGDVQLAVRLPEGAWVSETLATPSRARRVTTGSDQIAWSIGSLPAETILGPFAYRLRVGAGAGAVRSEATARWQTPSAGEARVSLAGYEDATTPTAVVPIGGSGSGRLVPLTGSGASYYVQAGAAPMTLTLTRTALVPPANVGQGQRWVASVRLDTGAAGPSPRVPIVLVLPLSRALPAFTPVTLFTSSEEGWQPGRVMGTVTEDGLHAAVAPDQLSSLAVGVDETILAPLEDPQLDGVAGEIQQAKDDTLVDLIRRTTAEVMGLVTDPPRFVPMTTDGSTHGTACTPSGRYCMTVRCDAAGCDVCFGDPADPGNWDCEWWPSGATGAAPVCGQPICYTPEGGATSTLDTVSDLSSFFESLGPLDVTNLFFQTSDPPSTGGTWQQVQGPPGDDTRLLFGVAVAENQVLRILGSAGSGRLELFGSGQSLEILVVQTMFEVATAGLSPTTEQSLLSELRAALRAALDGDSEAASLIVRNVRQLLAGAVQRRDDRGGHGPAVAAVPAGHQRTYGGSTP